MHTVIYLAAAASAAYTAYLFWQKHNAQEVDAKTLRYAEIATAVLVVLAVGAFL